MRVALLLLLLLLLVATIARHECDGHFGLEQSRLS